MKHTEVNLLEVFARQNKLVIEMVIINVLLRTEQCSPLLQQSLIDDAQNCFAFITRLFAGVPEVPAGGTPRRCQQGHL